MQKVFIARIFLFVILIVGVLYLLLYKGQPAAIVDKVNISAAVSESIETRHPPEGWREYKDITYHFSLLYPQELGVSERLEGGNAATITFQNVEKGMGFQIFIVPYSEQQISQERFKRDVPSGVQTDLENVTIDSAAGATFYSRDVLLGGTREIWFIRKEFLYEVTTLREQDAWLSGIIKTWLFL